MLLQHHQYGLLQGDLGLRAMTEILQSRPLPCIAARERFVRL